MMTCTEIHDVSHSFNNIWEMHKACLYMVRRTIKRDYYKLHKYKSWIKDVGLGLRH